MRVEAAAERDATPQSSPRESSAAAASMQNVQRARRDVRETTHARPPSARPLAAPTMKLSIALLAAPALAFTAPRHAAPRSALYAMDSAQVESKIDALAAEAKGIFDAKVDSAAAPVAGASDFTPATSGGTASNAGVDDLVKELQDAGAKFAEEIKAATKK